MMMPISFFHRYLMRMRRKPVNTRRIRMKMNGFATDSGSSNAVIPALCIGSERRRAAISTMISIAGIVRSGKSRGSPIMRPRESQVA